MIVVVLLFAVIILLAVIAVVVVQLARGRALTITGAVSVDEQVAELRLAVEDLSAAAQVARRSADRIDRKTAALEGSDLP